ncbi:hypothetical protein DFH28DRAFT_535631 [Melampsora americana]|nr:hypothetical protein DFH28DRAFT_535631 [Melampsora americana]
MMNFLVYIISFGHLLFSPVISVTFGDYQLTGGMFSDVSGQGPLLEPWTSQSNGLVPQGIKEVQEDSDHCIYINPELINDLDNIYPDHYYMLEFFESPNFPPGQESGAQPKEMSTTPTSMQVSLPIEQPLSTQRSERNLEMTNQPGQTESLISPKRKSKQSGTKLTSLSLTNSENPRKRKSRSQFHEEREIKKQIQSKHDQNYYYSVYEKIINSALQWQCRLLLSKRYKISEEIETFFNNIQKSYRSSFNNFLDGSDSDIINQVSIAIERIRTEFVMGVLGTFKILFQRNIKSELMDYLIFDLWEYLQIYLIKEFSLRPEEINPKPVKIQRNSHYTYIGSRKLFQYTLELSINCSIHSRFIHKMLQEWADTTSFKDHVLGITSDYWAVCGRM